VKPRQPRWRWLWRAWLRQVAVYTTRFLSLCPERLREPRWSRRCRFIGLNRLEAPLSEGRPVILATLHYGDLVMLYHWLRSRGIAVAFLAARKRKRTPAFRDRLDLLADRANGLVGVPRLIHPDQLWDAREFLGGPARVLAVAMERSTKRDVRVNGPGYSLWLSPGAIRMAAIVGAVVIPCLISSHGCLSSTIRFGSPVPQEDVADRNRHLLACEHIVRRTVPWVARQPEQCAKGLIASFETTDNPVPEAQVISEHPD